MNVEDDTLVIVRGINDDFFKENFGNLCISFGGDSRAVPVKDAYYVGLYLGAPDSAITHIGIVEKIERGDTPLYADFYLKAVIRLNHPVDPGHQIRQHEYWDLSDFKLEPALMEILKVTLLNIKV